MGSQHYRFNPHLADLDGRNRAIDIAESLARVIAVIRITSVGGHISPQNIEVGPQRPCIHCVTIRIA